MTHRKRSTAMLLTAAVTALTITPTPTAGAAPTGPACVEVAQRTTQCQTKGSAQISAAPPHAENPFFGPYALLLHHSRPR